MKRKIALLLALSLLLVLTACGQKVDPATLPGTLEGRTYTNTFFNLKCQAPVGWTYTDRAGLAEYNEISQEEFDSTPYGELLRKCDDELFDMELTAPTGATVSFVIAGGAAINNSMSDEKQVENEMESSKKQLESMGYEDVKASKGTTTLFGEERPCLDIEMRYEGITIYEKLCFLRGKGEYMAYLTVTYLEQADCTEILGLFSKLS